MQIILHSLRFIIGWFCPRNTGHNWNPCPRGTYSGVQYISDVRQCLPCDAGSYCGSTNSTTPTGKCADGFYCRNGSDSRTPSGGHLGDAGICPVGHYCPSGSPLAPIACPAGYYNNQTSRSMFSHCVGCPGGKFCEKPGLEWPSGNCDPGYYCTSKSKLHNPENVTAEGGPCPPGHYCPVGSASAQACPGGQYNSLWKQSKCYTCPQGHFCPNASSNYTECYQGYYCPNGSTSPNPCPTGTYKNYTMGHQLSDCKMCPPGMYCPLNAMPRPAGLCSPGWYCSGGSWEKQPLNTADIANGSSVCPLIGSIGGFCKKGSFCPEGSSAPKPCTPGYYCDKDNLFKEAGLCTAGYYCNGSTILSHPVNQSTGDVCPKGYFCPTGSSYPHPCSPGTYADKEYNQFKNNCMPCIPGMYCPQFGMDYPKDNCSQGFYCPAGQTEISPADKECQPGHFCPEGSGIQHPCPAGEYQPYKRQKKCIDCPEGSYCDPNEARLNSSSGSNSSSHGSIVPVDCPVGYYCPLKTTSANQYPCPKGTFGNTTKLVAKEQCLQCTKGHYCATLGKKYLPTGQCHAGYYCIISAQVPNPNDTITGAPCPSGSFCISGSYQPEKCPAGTFGPHTKLTHRNECVDCYGGQYCASPGLSAPNGSCHAGHYCSGKAILPNPVSQAYGSVCPEGHYCPERTTTPFKCPPGTFNNKTGGTSPTYCTPCPPGEYCQGYGRKMPNDKCDPGWYCSRGAYSPKPLPHANEVFNNSHHFTCPIYSVNSTGDICPKGSYCPRGSAEPRPCDAGKYCDRKELSMYTGNCTAGYYCKGGDTVANPRNCSEGYYCPEGTPIEVACPPGTFSPEKGNARKDQCQNCTAGYYCPSQGATSVVFQCLQGYYCPSGSINNATELCPKGYMCPTGSPSPQKCLPGFYQDETGKWSCKPCTKGFYCDPTALVTGVINPVKCAPGNYCPKQTATEKEHPCPAGTYSNKTGLERMDQCQPCPPKYYCGTDGLIEASKLCSAG